MYIHMHVLTYKRNNNNNNNNNNNYYYNYYYLNTKKCPNPYLL